MSEAVVGAGGAAVTVDVRSTSALPALFTPTPAAAKRTLEFFTANIRNPNTRKAHARAVGDFAAWCSEQDLRALGEIEPVHMAAYVEQPQGRLAAPSVKLHLAALRMLFDWLVVGQLLADDADGRGGKGAAGRDRRVHSGRSG